MNSSEPKSISLVREYLEGLGIHDYSLGDAQDGTQNIILVSIPKNFNRGLRLLLGKHNRNMFVFRRFLHLFGFIENRNNFLVIKLTEK